MPFNPGTPQGPDPTLLNLLFAKQTQDRKDQRQLQLDRQKVALDTSAEQRAAEIHELDKISKQADIFKKLEDATGALNEQAQTATGQASKELKQAKVTENRQTRAENIEKVPATPKGEDSFAAVMAKLDPNADLGEDAEVSDGVAAKIMERNLAPLYDKVGQLTQMEAKLNNYTPQEYTEAVNNRLKSLEQAALNDERKRNIDLGMSAKKAGALVAGKTEAKQVAITRLKRGLSAMRKQMSYNERNSIDSESLKDDIVTNEALIRYLQSDGSTRINIANPLSADKMSAMISSYKEKEGLATRIQTMLDNPNLRFGSIGDVTSFLLTIEGVAQDFNPTDFSNSPADQGFAKRFAQARPGQTIDVDGQLSMSYDEARIAYGLARVMRGETSGARMTVNDIKTAYAAAGFTGWRGSDAVKARLRKIGKDVSESAGITADVIAILGGQDGDGNPLMTRERLRLIGKPVEVQGRMEQEAIQPQPNSSGPLFDPINMPGRPPARGPSTPEANRVNRRTQSPVVAPIETTPGQLPLDANGRRRAPTSEELEKMMRGG